MGNPLSAPSGASASGIRLVILIAALCVALAGLTGCMTVTVSNSLLMGSTINQDKPIRAGVSTTGEAIGEVIKAAGWGGPDIGALKDIIEQWLKTKKAVPVGPQSRVHPFRWELRRC